jgi:UDP-glucose 4-epimerase
MKVLVTGGLGYIGSHTVTRLVEQGFEPIIIDNLSNSSIEVLDALNCITGTSLKFFKGDVQDISFVKAVLAKENGIEGIIHFAAYKAVNESMKDPLKYYFNNVGGLINLCEALKSKCISNFVFSSSCTVYGESSTSCISEDSPRKEAASPYGHTKLLGEDILKSLADLGHLKVVALRYFNPVGAHPSALIGELPTGVPQNLLPFITQTAAGKRKILKIFGKDYPTHDGTAIRDYIHVMDLADAHIKALEYLNNDSTPQYDTFNIGTGKGTSVLQLIQDFEHINKLKLSYEFTERRSGDITAIYANAQKANQKLNWKAQCSLDEALKSSWLWEQKLARC